MKPLSLRLVCIGTRVAYFLRKYRLTTNLFMYCWRWHTTMQSTQSTCFSFQKLEVNFLIVPLKRALITTRQGQFACSNRQNLNEAPINYTHYPSD